MAGLGGTQQKLQITRSRKTRLRLDVSEEIRTDLGFHVSRKPDEIARSNQSQVINCHNVKGAGWQLKPLNLDMGWQHENSAAAATVKKSTADGGTLEVPAGLLLFNVQRKNSDLTGALTGASANLATNGDGYYQKRVAAGTAWDDASFINGADATAFPSPNVSDNLVKMDRVMTDSVVHDPNKAFSYSFTTPGGSGHTFDEIARVYFSGPASSTKYWTGKGQWYISFRGDGKAILYERQHLNSDTGDPTSTFWGSMREFQYADPKQITGRTFNIHIRPHLYTPNRDGKSGSIKIFTASQASTQPGSMISYQASAQETLALVYYVPAIKTVATSQVPLRVDQRRDLAIKHQLATAKYPTTGSIKDDWISVHIPAGASKYLVVTWRGRVPAGTGIDIELWDARTGSQVTSTGSYTFYDGSGTQSDSVKYRTFNAVPQTLYYYVKILMTSDGTDTPTLYQCDVWKQSSYQTIAPTETVISGQYPALMNVSISGPEADPSHESGRVVIEDPTGSLATLRARGSIPCIIDTEYEGVDWTDTANEGLQSVLLRGYIESADATLKKNRVTKGYGGSLPGTPFPSQSWYSYDCAIMGAWQRLSEAQVPYNYDFGVDIATLQLDGVATGSLAFQPWKVTDVIRLALRWAGYQDYQIDIPDLPIRLFPKTTGDSLRVQPGQNIAELCVRLGRDYLASPLIFDANSGTGTDRTKWRGQWRIIQPKVAPYKNLAYFSTGGPPAGAAGVKMAVLLGSYPDVTSGSQVQKGAWILKGSFRSKVKRPEANVVTVSGTGFLGGDPNQESLLTCTIPNYLSFDFDPDNHTADSSSPDYLPRIVPLLYVSRELGTPEAVRWVATRLFQATCHAVKLVRFIAPLLLVTQADDTKQVRPRPLRYYDPVLLDGVQFLVRNVNPIYKKDWEQMAVYELEAPREPFI